MILRRSALIVSCVLVTCVGFIQTTHASPLPGEGEAAETEPGPTASTVVGNMGDARWTVPIELPPGPGGFAPTLALQYSSSQGDGPFGVGWTLPTGSVACSTRFGVPAYVLTGGSACPRFELDGGLLNDAGGGRYHTFVESFQRVLHKRSGGQNHWEVTSPDGVIRRYGTGPNSRILGPGSTIVRWLLSEVENPYGQVIHYGYDGDPADADLDPPTTGVSYLASIAYGPSSGGSYPERQVVVSYETRPDPIRDYAGGVLRHVALRASAIEVRSHGLLHSRHVLGWSQPDEYATHRSRLTRVQRVGADGTSALPAQEFRYTDAGDNGWPEWEEADYEVGLRDGPGQHFGFLVGVDSWPTASPPPVRTGDLDGDGLVDIIESRSIYQAGGVWLNTGDGFERSEEWQDAFATLQFLAPRVDVTYVPGSDIDVCGVDYTSLPQSVGFGDPRWDFPIAVDVSQENENDHETPTEAYVELLGNFHLADLNADGRSDLVMSIDFSGMYITHDCNGVALDPPVYTMPPEPEVRVAFRNTGAGWVSDPSLLVGLPPFGIVFTEGGTAHLEIWGGEDFECERMVGSQGGPAYPLNFNMAVFPCVNFSVHSPEFTDFNGDGRLDLVVAALDEDRPTLIVTNEFDPSSPEHSGKIESKAITTHSRVWISQPDGSWSPDPSFDLPLHHTRIWWLNSRCGRHVTCSQTLDAGVRILDRNRDGFADLTWDGLGAREEGAVLLNRGGGDGTAYSAWCSTRALPMGPGEPAVPLCPVETGAERFLLPPGEKFIDPVYDNMTEGTELADVNGDGWPDLIRNDHYHPTPREKAFLFTPGWAEGIDGVTGNWVENGDFNPPAFIGLYPGVGGAYIASDVRVLDLDGDGAADFIRGDGRKEDTAPSPPRESWLGRSALADLLREVRTGQGGVVAIEYAGAAQQRDRGLEVLAEAHASEHLETPGPEDPVQYTSSPVVSRVRVTPLNTDGVAAETSYRYAHPRTCLEHRERHGFRLVRRTRPDGSISDTYFYQHHGRAGRVSRRVISDASGPLQSVEELWELPDPATVPGAWAGDAVVEASHVGRLASRRTALEYGAEVGDATGAVQVENYFYNDSHGYNMLLQIESERASTHTLDTRFPRAADTSRWILNRIETQQLHKSGGHEPFARLIVRSYTDEGALATQKVWRNRRDGLDSEVPPPAQTSYVYDAYGNLVQRVDPRGNPTDFCYDGVPSNPPWCVSPAGQTSGSVLVGRRDPPVGGEPGVVTQIVPDPVFGVPAIVVSGYADVPMTRVALDPLGREIASFVTPTDDDEEIQQTKSEYYWDWNDPNPPHTVRYAYTEAGQSDVEAIRTVEIGDGFGGVWKEVRQADVPGSGKYVGAAVHRDPAANLTAQTYDYACTTSCIGDSCTGSEFLCGNVSGADETAALVTRRDALGRPTSLQSPDGTSLFDYRAVVEPVVGPYGTIEAQAVDVVLEQNAKGDLTRRSLDGDRLLATEECTNSDPGRSASQLAAETCAAGNGPNRTLYGYHPTGQLESIIDPLGNVLRYHYDTSGQVIRLDDPDAGISYTEYDEAGNVALTGNLDGNGDPVPSRERVYAYDELNRLTGITTPAGEPDHTLFYRSGELQMSRETTADFRHDIEYDGLGRVWREYVNRPPPDRPRATYDYDLTGRRIGVHYGSSQGVGYVYEGAYLKRILCQDPNCPEDAEGGVVISNVEYDELGRRSLIDMPAGERSFDYTPDDRRHLSKDRFENTRTGHTEFSYGSRDPLGNVVGWATSSSMNGLEASNGLYSYDHRNRLASWSYDAPTGGVAQQFGYDPLGNLTVHGTGGEQNQYFEHPTKPHAITGRSGGDSYAYDEWGNLASTTEGGVTRHYTFDSADRLVCVGSSQGACDLLEVAYSASGQRMKQDSPSGDWLYVGDEFRWGNGPNGWVERAEITAFGERVAYSVRGSGSGAAAPPPWALPAGPPAWLLALPPLAALAWLGLLGLRGGLRVGVARQPARATLSGVLAVSLCVPFPVEAGGGNAALIPTFRWVISDPLGSGLLEVDSDGMLLRHTRFAPFGGLDAEAAPPLAPNPRRFYAGHPQQEDTGLTYMKARWMNPTTGTFLSVDPLIVPDDPQSHTGYSYARNNPVSITDPTGQLPVPLIVIGIGVVVGGVAGAKAGNIAHGVKVGLFTAATGLAISAISTTTGAASALGVTPSTFRAGANALSGGGTEALNGGDLVSVTAATLSAGATSKVSDLVEGGLTTNSLGAVFGEGGEATGAVAAVSPTVGAVTGEAIGQGVEEVGEAVENFPEVPGSVPFPRPATPGADSGPQPPARGPQDFREAMEDLGGTQRLSPPPSSDAADRLTAIGGLP